MRTSLMRLLPAAAVLLWGCSDSVDPPPPGSDDDPDDGSLIVSTSTTGGDPDPDGFQLVVDDTNSVLLRPADSVQVAVPAGRYTLRLLGVASNCTVAPTSAEVEVASGSATRVAFEVGCPATAARITVTTAGIDLDPDGYRLSVDGVDTYRLPANGTVVIRLQPGTHTLDMMKVPANCAMEGHGSRTLTVEDPETVPVEFSVVCRAVTGVIGVIVEASGRDRDGAYYVEVEGFADLTAALGQPIYSRPVPSGAHVVLLITPFNCTAEHSPQSVNVPAGGLVRDTVVVTFTVTCRRLPANVRITAATSGRVPSSPYRVMHETYSYWDYGGTATFLGSLAPNDTLFASVPPTTDGAANYWHWFWLENVPADCSVRDSYVHPVSGPTIPEGEVVDVEFEVACPP